MEIQSKPRVLDLLVLQVLTILFAFTPNHAIAYLNRSSFPDGFLFGAGSSAYQFEGAANMDGRKPSIWDTFTKDHPEKITDRSSGRVAIDSYHNLEEDVTLMKEIGLDTFRFSISWSRILPNGKISGGINWHGVYFYSHLIDQLISNHIQPFVTLFHWDLPQALEDEYGGFLSPNILNDFHDYADFCFQVFGDRVKHWITVNEPNLFSVFGYATGVLAPGRCSDYIGSCKAGNSATEPYIVLHNLILSHATAVKLYKDKYQASQKGIIGPAVHGYWVVPKYETVASTEAAYRALQFIYDWFVHPITYGDYPKVMKELVGNRLPKFTESQLEMVKGSLDFLGINYYTTLYADGLESCSTLLYADGLGSCGTVNLSYTTDSCTVLTQERNGVPLGQPTGSSWLNVYPKGLEEILLYTTRTYNNTVIYITENGMADNTTMLPLDSPLEDSWRVQYHILHLSSLLKSIKEGADVRGYLLWSLLDNFEWNSGYTLRFGINFVDYANGLKRHRKSSALWFKRFLDGQ